MPFAFLLLTHGAVIRGPWLIGRCERTGKRKKFSKVLSKAEVLPVCLNQGLETTTISIKY